jgi:hypothetical protein
MRNSTLGAFEESSCSLHGKHVAFLLVEGDGFQEGRPSSRLLTAKRQHLCEIGERVRVREQVVSSPLELH